jgi:peptidoglycan/xylan/chitin deacetylase (PgdA/CDA1 family)
MYMTRRKFLKLTGAAAIFSSALPRAMHAAGAQSEEIRIPALLYHDIAFEHDDYTVSPPSFSAQMERLFENGYRTLAINDAGEFLKNGTGPAVILTFDDGYASFMDYAFPLLKDYGFRALVNIIGQAVDNHALLDTHRPVLSWDECRYLRDSGLVDLGCHSYGLHSQHSRRSASYQVIETDLMRFQEKYKKELGTRCSAIAWPYGIYDKKCIEIAHRAGFTYLFTSNEGFIERGSALNELPRLNINDKLDLTSFQQYIGAKA